MSNLIIIVEKDDYFPPYLSGGGEVVNEESLNLKELAKKGRFFSRYGGCSLGAKGVREAIKCDGWVIFTEKN